MLKLIAASAALITAPIMVVMPAQAQAQAAAPAALSTAATTIGDLLDNPAAKAVLVKHIPEVVAGDQIEMARGMTLVDIQQYAADVITDAKLAAIDADLAKLGK
ncbi:hypothetical protein SAMN06295912_10456 [Sphingomonas laterariae]|uniref:Uncharacterized protein n=1 Tax=Edaphosphingomonas laterariae TaxID=861865 RepID=A0A239DFD1_9SPHN|nr:hypothetical protein [Sphingomonas laterariae]SNS30544.1 hypothetical protein SAMN06295912_10456 [Sphingomonas laterariae]